MQTLVRGRHGVELPLTAGRGLVGTVHQVPLSSRLPGPRHTTGIELVRVLIYRVLVLWFVLDRLLYGFWSVLQGDDKMEGINLPSRRGSCWLSQR